MQLIHADSSQLQGSAEPASRLWVPSQNAPVPECLQPHQATVLASVNSVFNGDKPVPLCEPSQKGCCADRPHLHHQ
jgi:hypothetical protein